MDSPVTGFSHVQFRVHDIGASRAWYETVIGIDHPGVVLELGKPSLQLRDPDGNAIELVAPVPRE